MMGQIPIAEWLIKRFALGGARILGGDITLGIQLLAIACGSPHPRRFLRTNLALGDWAVDMFAISTYDFRSHSLALSILYPACECGDVMLVQWLAIRLKLSICDIHEKLPDFIQTPLTLAYEKGHLDLVRFLTRHFSIGYTDIAYEHASPKLIELAWQNGHFALIRWFSNYYARGLDSVVKVAAAKKPARNGAMMRAWIDAMQRKIA
jgi:hypothetical protein